MIALHVELLTGRYAATAYARRDEGEWPPHPARLFSALVATLHDAETVDPREEAALRWLEALPPPAIVASDASPREVVQHWVPVNDVEVVGTFDEQHDALRALSAAAELAASRAGDGKDAAKAAANARKAAEKASEAFSQRWRKAVVLTTDKAPTAEDGRAAERVLPDARTKQPRTFPTVVPHDPRVVFTWREVEAAPDVREALGALARRVVRLGHSSSLVRAWVSGDAGEATWIPARHGELVLRGVAAGQLDALRSGFERHTETEPRVMPSVPVRYARPTPPAAPGAPKSTLGSDWVVFTLEGHAQWPIVATDALTSTLRKAWMSHAGRLGAVPRVLSGHEPNGAPTVAPHVAFLGLPFVGVPHADGLLRGLAAALPPGADGEEIDTMLSALDAWEETARGPHGHEGTPRLRLVLGAAGEAHLRRVEGHALRTLQVGRWMGPATTWRTCTPIVLDGFPGALGRDGGRAEAKAAALIARACERIGLPRPASVEVLSTPPVMGARPVRAFPRFLDPTTGKPRVKVHAAIAFPEPVVGPVVVGAGRYRGLGLCVPMSEPR